MPSWKSPRSDRVQEYWIKNAANLYPRKALQLDRCLQENNLSKWIVT